jgi:hypothetical protein
MLFGYYTEQIHAIFDRYTPLVEPLWLDEALPDATGSESCFDSLHQQAADAAGCMMSTSRLRPGVTGWLQKVMGWALGQPTTGVDYITGWRTLSARRVVLFAKSLQRTRNEVVRYVGGHVGGGLGFQQPLDAGRR